MRALFLATTTVAVAALTCPLEGQELADRMNSTRANVVRFSFPTRAEICGDGKSIGEATADGLITHTFWSGGHSIDNQRFWEIDCRRGPMRLVVERRAGNVTELRAAVGVAWQPDAPGVDLGTFSGDDAATWLLDIAETNFHTAYVAFLAANAAADAEIANRLFSMARNNSLHNDVRQRAIRWMNKAAGREGLERRADRIIRDLAADGDENTDVRERAIRSLRETSDNDAWLRGQFGRLNRRQLQERVIRRIGQSQSEENLDWLRSVALNTNEHLELRERSLRVIGETTEGHDELRELFGRMDRPALKERVLRVIGEKATAEESRWLRSIAMDVRERSSVRERAIRVLGEDADLATMQRLFRDVEGSALRERVLRMVGEQRSAEGADWLEQVATDRDETVELRARAIRLLGEYDSDVVRGLFETLDYDELRDRAMRVVAERGDRGTTEWLAGIATGSRYSTEVRDRAVRLLGERAIQTSEIAALYQEVNTTDLRRRVIRLLAERNDETAVETLRTIAESDPSREMRRYAMRRLAEIR